MTDVREQERTKRFTAEWLKAQNTVLAFIHASIHNYHDAEDVFQSVGQAAAEHFDDFDSSRCFTAWVLGIARNHVLRYFRQRHRDRHIFSDQAMDAIAQAHADVAPETDVRFEALRQCMRHIGSRASAIVDMRYRHAMSPAQIGQTLGLTAVNVRVLLHRVRQQLAECVERRMAQGGEL